MTKSVLSFQDFLYVLRFWLTYFILGLIAFPLTSRIFSRFLDRGWIFSKTLGILLVSFLMWYAASFKILPFSFTSLLIVTSLITLISLISLLWENIIPSVHHVIPAKAGIQNQQKAANLDPRRSLSRTELRDGDERQKEKNPKFFWLILFEEILFFVCLWLWSYVRSFQPIIEGLEKYMDFGFINAILRSPYTPPHDMWLSGYTINYYYFGHFMAAVLTRLSQIPPEVVYNLMIAVIFAFCFTASFSIGLNLIWHFCKNFLKTANCRLLTMLFPALLTAYLVTNAANLQPVYHLLTKGSSTYWYPDATRFIVKKFGATDETIHEFPHYSFVVADLHGHVSDIPTVLFLIGFTFVLFLKLTSLNSVDNLSFRRKPESRVSLSFLSPLSIFDSLLLGFLLSTAYMTNAMDGPVYFGLAGLAVLGGYLVEAPLAGAQGQAQGLPLQKIKNAFLKSAIFFLFVGLTFVIFSFPFLKNFKNFTGGITPVDYHSPFWMLMILWGFQLFMGLSFLIFLFAGKIFKRETIAKTVAGIFGVELKLVDKKKSPKFPSAPPSPFQTTDLFILFLLLLSLGLIIFPEIFYIKDIYIHEYQRANTMFKMTYQAFIMLYIAAVYIFFRILFHIKTTGRLLFPQILFLLLSLAGFISVSIYPYYAVKSYYGLVNYQGLDGMKYLQPLYPDDYKLITYLNSQKNQLLFDKNAIVPRPSDEFDTQHTVWPQTQANRVPIILEAVGDSYTKYARIAANTGLPTVLGWPVHEWLWRNGYDLAGTRTADVQKIYESTDLAETKNLLLKYHVDYVWIGQLEREKYKNLDEFKFRKIGKVELKIGNSVLYKID